MVLDYVSAGVRPVTTLNEEAAQQVTAAVMARINAEFGARDILAPDAKTEARLRERIRLVTQAALRQAGLGSVSVREENELVERIANQLLGLGFLEKLLPPARTDLSEIMINPDGRVWLMPKGQTHAVGADDIRPSVAEVRLVIDKILGSLSRRVSEAEPIVAAKLPRSDRLPAGARVNVVVPPIANGPYPMLNVRLYEEKPVLSEQLLAWGALNQEMIELLIQCVQGHLRIMICGGTVTGKTTLLSCVASFIPPEERVVLVEDPAEIFLDHPHVASLEARPPNIEGHYGVSLGDLVTTAMRMSPRWLVVGEVRTGKAAVWLLRAQMSDHPGLSTIHADSPRAAVETLCLLAQMDLNVRREATKHLIARAIDLFVHIGYDRWNRRRVMRITEVVPELKHGDVWLNDVYRFDEDNSTADRPVWAQVGQVSRTRR